jgi:mono/diheme cytochrome c family protein
MSRAVGVAATVAWLCASSASGAESQGLSRGEYLVGRVGMCQDCHSPRDAQGALAKEQWLSGAPIDFTPSVPMPWAETAPPIAGLPTMTGDQAIRFLMTGERPDGSRSRPPMPEYRLTREDAEAVVDYLMSLAPRD